MFALLASQLSYHKLFPAYSVFAFLKINGNVTASIFGFVAAVIITVSVNNIINRKFYPNVKCESNLSKEFNEDKSQIRSSQTRSIEVNQREDSTNSHDFYRFLLEHGIFVKRMKCNNVEEIHLKLNDKLELYTIKKKFTLGGRRYYHMNNFESAFRSTVNPRQFYLHFSTKVFHLEVDTENMCTYIINGMNKLKKCLANEISKLEWNNILYPNNYEADGTDDLSTINTKITSSSSRTSLTNSMKDIKSKTILSFKRLRVEGSFRSKEIKITQPCHAVG